MIELQGKCGSTYPWEWAARQVSVASTSSGENESVGWSMAAKAGIRCAAILECLRRTEVYVEGHCDADALRLAVERGSSQQMGHLRRYAEASFQFLQECGIPLRHIPGTENVADVFTKVLSAEKTLYLTRSWFGHDLTRNSHGSVVQAKFVKKLVGLITRSGMIVLEKQKDFVHIRHHSSCPLYGAEDWGILDEQCTCQERATVNDIEESEDLKLIWLQVMADVETGEDNGIRCEDLGP